MGGRYTEYGAKSKLAEIPTNSDFQQAVKVIQQNQDTIWKAIGDLRLRIDDMQK